MNNQIISESKTGYALSIYLIFFLIEGIIQTFNIAGMGEIYKGWDYPPYLNLIVGPILILITSIGLFTKYDVDMARLAALISIGLGLGYAVGQNDYWILDSIWYFGFTALMAAVGGFAHDRSRNGWAASLLSAWLFFLSGLMNAFNYYDVQSMYPGWGLPRWWNYVTAVYEIGVAVLMLVPATRILGGVAAAALMVVISMALTLNAVWHKFIELAWFILPAWVAMQPTFAYLRQLRGRNPDAA